MGLQKTSLVKGGGGGGGDRNTSANTFIAAVGGEKQDLPRY